MALRRRDFNIGWLCALAVEADAVLELLDGEPLEKPDDLKDSKSGIQYDYGKMGSHKIVIRTLATGITDNTTAATAISHMNEQFPEIQHFVFSGVGGGLPREIDLENPDKNLYLGDVVIATPVTGHSGVINTSVNMHSPEGQQLMHIPDKSSMLWRETTSYFVNHYNRGGRAKIEPYLQKFPRPSGQDRLFRSDSLHVPGQNADCQRCDATCIIPRPERNDTGHPRIFQEAVVTGDLIKSGKKRDEISRRYPDARVVDMESSGFIDGYGTLIVRGISDYADDHKSDKWQKWAAGRAAAVAKGILLSVSPGSVEYDSARSFSEDAPVDYNNLELDELEIPYRLCDDFNGYDSVISRLEEKLIHGRKADEKKHTVVLYGKAGTGKRSACYMFYQKHLHHFWGAWIINASSEANIAISMANIMSDLKIPEIQFRNETPDSIIKQAKQLLERINKRWLLILEECDADIPYMSKIPSSTYGSSIIISCKPECCFNTRFSWASMPSINETEAMKLLWYFIKVDECRPGETAKDALRELVKRLKCWPMGIRTAATTIIRAPSSSLYSVETRIYSFLEDHGGKNLHTAMESFSVLLKSLKQHELDTTTVQDALDLLKLLAFWSSGGVPGSLLKTILKNQSKDQASHLSQLIAARTPSVLVLKSQDVDQQMVRVADAVGLLDRFSLITYVTTGKGIEGSRLQIRPIFQECVRILCFEEEANGTTVMLQAFLTLAHCTTVKDSSDHSILHRSILPHLESLEHLAENSANNKWLLFQYLDFSIAGTVVLNFSMTHFDSGKIMHAEEQQKYVYQKYDIELSPDKEVTLRAQAYLATSRHDQRARSQAKNLREKLVSVIEEELLIHNTTGLQELRINALIGLADSYDFSIHDRAKAIRLREMVLQALKHEERSSIRFLNAEQRSARSRHLAGQTAEALTMREKIYKLTQKWSGKQKIRFDAIGELAESLHARGLWQRARELRETHVKETVASLGKEHPDTLAAKLNLASSYSALSRPMDARRLRNEVYKVRCRNLESEIHLHPMTLHASVLLAQSWKECGQPDTAYTMLKQAFSEWEKSNKDVRDKYQEDLLALRDAIATLLEEKCSRLSDDHPNCYKLYEEASEHRRCIEEAQAATFGKESNELLMAKAKSAWCRATAGRLDEACEETRKILQQWTQQEGNCHHDHGCLKIMRQLAIIYRWMVQSYDIGLASNGSYDALLLENVPASKIMPAAPASDNLSTTTSSHFSNESAANSSEAEHGHVDPEKVSAWQAEAIRLLEEIVRIQTSQVRMDKDLDQSALQDMINLGDALSKTNATKALELYQRAFNIMQQPERLGLSVPLVQRLRDNIEYNPRIKCLQWLDRLIPESQTEPTKVQLIEDEYGSNDAAWEEEQSWRSFGMRLASNLLWYAFGRSTP